MRIFVAGATGVVGRRVVPKLVESGHDITAVGRTPEKRRRLEDRVRRHISANLVAASLSGQVRRVIQESFAPIYADGGDAWLDETAEVRPVETEPMRRRDLAEGLAQTLGVKPPRFLPDWVTALGGGVAATLARSLRISNRKLREASDWAPRYPTMLEGLRAIIDG